MFSYAFYHFWVVALEQRKKKATSLGGVAMAKANLCMCVHKNDSEE